MTEITVQIDGMSCGHCLNAVNRAVAQVAGVQAREIRIGQARVTVESPEVTGQLLAAITEAGYPASVVSTPA
jgi:copper chaperone CopZ